MMRERITFSSLIADKIPTLPIPCALRGEKDLIKAVTTTTNSIY